jgi:beta-glucosidase
MRTKLILLFVVLVSAVSAQITSGWQLVWSDEFNGAAGSPPDPTKWNYDLGGGGWGNGEAETYTNSTQNAFQDGNGNLVIRAIRSSSGAYTSARLQTGSPGASTHTTDLSWQYGMVVARIKLPFGHGVWPAFWMLGENIGTVSWPACGEVDIMENFGAYGNVNDQAINNGTAHGPVATGSSTDYNAGGQYALPLGELVSDDYHVYAIQWSANSVAFYVDGNLYYTATPSSVPAGQWPFNNPFFILLNLAIGGNSTFLGTPDPNAPFPNQDMLVDYVRVYQSTPVPAATPVITPGQVVNGASYLGDLAPGGLATLYGSNLADAQHLIAANPTFPTSVAGVSVSVNGVAAPLIYVSPTQINFQIPWETTPGPDVPITVTWNSAVSAVESVTVAAPQAPSMFLSEPVNGVAWVTGTGCETTECAVQAGGNYQLWANALGPKNGPSQDGAGAVYNGSLTPLEVPGSPASCQLTIGGQVASVQYCGAAPGEIIDQINFVYPAGVTATAAYVEASLTIGSATGYFRVPAPATADPLAQQLLAQMTQSEKLQLVHGAGGPVTNIIPLPRGAGGYIPGIQRLGIPDLYFNDGSVGVANSQAPATALPSAIASAASWDPNLAYQYGQVIGAEMSAYGLNVNLGGNVNLGREPRDGRTFETKGEDPILAGKINAAHVRAIQDQQVVGCIKHYALNDQETGRTTANAMIDERSARETDLLAFEIGVRDANVQSVMCSYNLVNGAWSCENPHLLTDVLKSDWGFPGFVMSDWWASHSTVAAANAGLDQEQPDNQWFSGLDAAVQAGAVPQSRLDDMVERVLRALYQTGVMGASGAVTPVNTAADQAVAQQVEEQGAVLLQNTGNQLPLNPATVGSIAVIGSHADVGVLSGGGSAQVYPTGGVALNEGYPTVPGWSPVIWDPSSPLKAIQAMAPNATVRFDDGTNTPRAAAVAASSAVAIVFVSQWTSEGMDMPSLNFTDVIHTPAIDQDGLVSAVASANPHTIVVMENGGAQVLPWLASVSAVLEAWFPGQRGGEAIANILFGAVNPSGKLPVTFPASVSDLPHPSIAGPVPPSSTAPFPVNYSEGLLVGYKWYDANNLNPVFHFGFGLSYTTFMIANIGLTNNLTTSNPNFQVSCDLTNTGSVSGAEVVQVYLGLPSSLGEPPRRLAGWQKVSLQPGALQHVTIEVDESDSSHPMSWWSAAADAWQTAPGDYTVYVGNSSAAADLTVAGTLHLGS